MVGQKIQNKARIMLSYAFKRHSFLRLHIKGMSHLFLICLVCFLAAGCATPTIPPPGLDRNTVEEERRLWDRAEEEQAVLEESGIIYDDQELGDYLHQIAVKLQPLETREKFNFRIKLIRDPFLNAFAFPNGVIYVHTGLLARLENEAQLAALLAHEMTHCINQHTLRSLKGLKNERAAYASRKQALSKLGWVGEFVALLGATGTMAAVNGYSQTFETEADMGGLELMAKAGYEPAEALRLFEHLKQEAKAENFIEPYFFGTHPRLQKRIENSKGYMEHLSQTKGRDIKTREIFLEKIDKVIFYNAFLDLKAGRFGAAQRGAEKYLSIKQGDAKAYFLLGEIFRQRGGSEGNLKAKNFYEKAIMIDASYADPHKAIGLIYYKEGEWMLAKRSFELSLSLSPNLSDRAYIQGYLEKCSKREAGP